ncbi:transposase [Colletotrichum higginsianum]|uniref:Transposase n=1 Tax=Colletotrichum higginsianum (strain IMI 349063) TaxID=759273 RepID=H1VKU4_COLHI|nr:transposase [Colletotrichum higginsianum]
MADRLLRDRGARRVGTNWASNFSSAKIRTRIARGFPSYKTQLRSTG